MYERHIKNRRGFTLLELLVAMALTATLIVVAVPAFTFVARYTRSQLDSTSLRGDIRLAAARIREDVRNSVTQSISGEDESILTLDGITWQVDSGSGVLTRTADGKTDSFSAVGKAAFGIQNFSRSPVVTITLSSGVDPDVPVVFHQAVRPAGALNPGTPPPPPDPGGGGSGEDRPVPQPGIHDIAWHWNGTRWEYYTEETLIKNFSPQRHTLYFGSSFEVNTRFSNNSDLVLTNYGNIEIYEGSTVNITLPANRQLKLISLEGSILLDGVEIIEKSAGSPITFEAHADISLNGAEITARKNNKAAYVFLSAGRNLFVDGLILRMEPEGTLEMRYENISGSYTRVAPWK